MKEIIRGVELLRLRLYGFWGVTRRLTLVYIKDHVQVLIKWRRRWRRWGVKFHHSNEE